MCTREEWRERGGTRGRCKRSEEREPFCWKVYERREESTRRESHSEIPYLLSGVIGNTFTRNLWLIRVLNRVGEILNILGVLKKKEKIRTGRK